VQLYYRDNVASVARPDRTLVGFARVPLQAGEKKRVTFIVDPSRLAFYDPGMRFVIEPGEFTFAVGASSADIRAEQVVTLGGEVVEYRQRDIVATRVEIA
jgi:beta-glucosidase